MDFLEYSSIHAEQKGCMTTGRLKMTETNIIFKNDKTGKVEQFTASEIDLVNFQKFVGHFGLRFFMKNGSLHRFSGFTGDEKKISEFVKSNYKIDVLEKELSMRGWNWGTVQFKGSVLSFDVENKSSFEIPLNHVSQCIPGKNEVTLEFHQNDDAPVSLMECRFHVPSNDSSETDAVDAFFNNVMNKASVISVSGDAIAIFREIQCLTPRGRYDIKVFQSFFQLHGKTFDYKIPLSTVLRLFLLPHRDNRQMFFVISLDPPIKQGQTRYHFLVFLFAMEEETSIELPFTDEELKEKYEDKLARELSGPVYEVLGKIMKVIINRKLTGPGTFIGHSGTPAVGCSFKAAAGYLYPLERGFIYVHKPPMHIRFEEIASVNFARSGGSTKSFDFEIELKSGVTHTFSSIEKEEYNKLYDFITSKKLHVKNTGKNDKGSYKDDFGDSDNEAEPDAYLARVKAEAEERDSDDGGSDEESTDEDFNPNAEESDVAEEYDSNVSSSESDGSDNSHKQKKRKEKAERKEKRKSASPKKQNKEGGRKKKGSKKDRDPNAPKRPMTAFMMYLNDNREAIKSDNPGISVTEIAKKGGEMWGVLKDKTKWEERAEKGKEAYRLAMLNYVPTMTSPVISLNKELGEKRSSAGTAGKAMAGDKFKSKEYISDDSTDSEKAGADKVKKSKKDKKEKGSTSEKKKLKKEVSASEEEEEVDEEMDEDD